MDTDDERLADLDYSLERLDGPRIGSAEEFFRQQEVRAATLFGSTTPRFRTRVALRFSGKAVRGHDLNSLVAGDVIQSFAEAVRSAGRHVTSPMDGCDLFLSPHVTPGSTVFELFGVPRVENSGTAGMEPLDPQEIPDTPVDQALQSLFDSLDRFDLTSDPDSDFLIDGDLGKHLFKLTKSLIENEVDLGMSWQRPRGVSRQTDLSVGRAIALRAALDKPTVQTDHRRETGIVEGISTKGTFDVKLRSGTVRLAVPDDERETLRALWGREVVVEFTTTTTSHPNRAYDKPEHLFVKIEPAGPRPEQPALDGLDPEG